MLIYQRVSSAVSKVSIRIFSVLKTWSRLAPRFACLVAAVVADALDQPSYDTWIWWGHGGVAYTSSNAGWFISWNLKWMIIEGSPIFGNHYIYIYIYHIVGINHESILVILACWFVILDLNHQNIGNLLIYVNLTVCYEQSSIFTSKITSCSSN